MLRKRPVITMTAETYQFFTGAGSFCGNFGELEMMMDPTILLNGIAPAQMMAQAMAGETRAPLTDEARLLAAAQALEAGFLSEMLKAAGIGETPGQFGGGAGEDHFASFLRDAQAKEMVAAGGLGLAQSLFEAMLVRPDA